MRRVTGVFAFLLLAAFSVWAQTDANKGQISGLVLDEKEAVIQGATINIRNVGTGAARQLTSGDGGEFRAVLLDPGRYEVRVEAPGFAPSIFENVILTVGSAVTLPVTMKLGTTAQTIEVSAVAITTDIAAPTTNVNLNLIRNLPINGRRFTDFAALTPAVQIDQQRGSISFVGQRGINGNIMLDGADYNNPFFGGTRGGERSNFVPTVPQSAVEEFQAVTTGYAAEYGRSTGGLLNVITRSGANVFHGDGFYQIRHKETGLKNPFGTQSLETLQQFGGGIGGPIMQDKLFFFTAVERQRSRLPGRQVQFPTLAGLAPTAQTADALAYYRSIEEPILTTNDATVTTGRLDYQMSDGSRLTARFNFSDANANNAITTGAPLPAIDTRALSGTGSEKDRTYSGAAQWTWLLGPRMANDLRYSGTHELRPRSSNSLVANVSNNIGNFGARNFLPTVQDDTRHQISNGFSVTQDKHTMKFGMDYSYLTTAQAFGFNQFGSFSFSTTNINDLLRIMSVAPGQNRFDNAAAQYRLQVGNLAADYQMHQIAFYAQDTWKIHPQLQLSFGLRWEGQKNPDPVANNTAVVDAIKAATFPLNGKFDPSRLQDNMNQWMPRFGFTWNPSANSTKTVIRGHAGLFYAATPMLTFGGSTNNFRVPPGDVSFFIPGGAGQPTVYQVFQRAGIDLNNFTLGALPTPDVNALISAYSALTGTTPNPFAGASFTGTANDFQNPRAFQIGLGVDREVMSNWVVGAQFNYVNTVHLTRNRDYNLPLPTVRAADGRAVYNRNLRPLPQYGQITIRESSARSMYRGATFTTKYTKGRVQFGSQYTLAEAFSDDDNERDATGFRYNDANNFRAEYGYSNLDVRHQMSLYGVINTWYGIELAPIFRAVSGQPIDPLAGADLNGDGAGSTNERAYRAVGVPFERNAFRNEWFKTIDLRFLKSFQLGERFKLQFSTEMFNMFNFDNVVIGPSAISTTNTIYGAGIDAAGAVVAPRATFMRLKCSADNPCGTVTEGYDRSNSQVGNPFQAQFGLRLLF